MPVFSSCLAANLSIYINIYFYISFHWIKSICKLVAGSYYFNLAIWLIFISPPVQSSPHQTSVVYIYRYIIGPYGHIYIFIYNIQFRITIPQYLVSRRAVPVQQYWCTSSKLPGTVALQHRQHDKASHFIINPNRRYAGTLHYQPAHYQPAHYQNSNDNSLMIYQV